MARRLSQHSYLVLRMLGAHLVRGRGRGRGRGRSRVRGKARGRGRRGLDVLRRAVYYNATLDAAAPPRERGAQQLLVRS